MAIDLGNIRIMHVFTLILEDKTEIKSRALATSNYIKNYWIGEYINGIQVTDIKIFK